MLIPSSGEPDSADWSAAVQQVAGELAGLLPADEASTVSTALAPLLARPDDEGALDEIVVLLAEYEPARRRLNELLGAARPTGRYPGYAGDSLLRYDRYACPDCQRAWVVLDADEDERPPERCPDDGSMLTFVAAT